MNRHSFEDVIKNSWAQPVRNSPMLALCMRLRRSKPVLRAFNKQHFLDISSKVSQARLDLEQCRSSARTPLLMLPCMIKSRSCSLNSVNLVKLSHFLGKNPGLNGCLYGTKTKDAQSQDEELYLESY